MSHWIGGWVASKKSTRVKSMGIFHRVAAVAVSVLSVSALSAEAKPWRHRQSDYPENQQYSQRRGDHHRNHDDDRYSNRRDEDQDYGRYGNQPQVRFSNRGRDWQNSWNNGNDWGGRRSRTSYYQPGAYYTSLPSGCRRVVVRQTTYYTPDNSVFFTFSPSRNIYVVVNNPFRFF